MDLISQFMEDIKELKKSVAKDSIQGVKFNKMAWGFKIRYVKDRWDANAKKVNNHVENLQWKAAYINGLKDACEILSELIQERKECSKCLKNIPKELKELL